MIIYQIEWILISISSIYDSNFSLSVNSFVTTQNWYIIYLFDFFSCNLENKMQSCCLPSQIVYIPKTKTRICILIHRKEKAFITDFGFFKTFIRLTLSYSSHKMRNCCCPLCKTCEFVEFAFSVFNPIIYLQLPVHLHTSKYILKGFSIFSKILTKM